jgi:hypothetical protein
MMLCGGNFEIMTLFLKLFGVLVLCNVIYSSNLYIY